MPASPRPADVLCRLLALWPEDPAGFAAACSAIADWHALLEEAARHGVLGVLARPLLEPTASLSAEVHCAIEARRLAERLWSERLERGLAEALAVLEDAEVPAVVLKGPVLSERLHDDFSVRLSTDLDILIRSAHLDRAATGLEALGYTAPAGPASRYHRRHHHHLGLDRPQGPRIELHFRAFTGLGVEMGGDDFLARSGRYQSPRRLNCLVLSPEDELLFLAVHAAGHGWSRLAWLYDLKTWLRRFATVRWPIVFGRARRRQVETALVYTLEMLHRRLGVAVPTKERSGRHRGHMADQLLAWYERVPEGSRRGKLLAFLLQASLCDRPALAFGYLRHHFGRILRRRLHRWLPALAPEDWSG